MLYAWCTTHLQFQCTVTLVPRCQWQTSCRNDSLVPTSQREYLEGEGGRREGIEGEVGKEMEVKRERESVRERKGRRVFFKCVLAAEKHFIMPFISPQHGHDNSS